MLQKTPKKEDRWIRTRIDDTAVETIAFKFVSKVAHLSEFLPLEDTYSPFKGREVSGDSALSPTPRVDVADLPLGLKRASFSLVDATERQASGDKYITRFVFTRGKRGIPHGWALVLDKRIFPAFESLCSLQCWQVSAYRIPFVRSGNIVSDKEVLRFCLCQPAVGLKLRDIEGEMVFSGNDIVLSFLEHY